MKIGKKKKNIFNIFFLHEMGKKQILIELIQFLLHLKLKYLIFRLINEQMKKIFFLFFLY